MTSNKYHDKSSEFYDDDINDYESAAHTMSMASMKSELINDSSSSLLAATNRAMHHDQSMSLVTLNTIGKGDIIVTLIIFAVVVMAISFV